MISLHNLKPHYGSMHKRKRLGTGQGSGHGQTSTRGQKGQHSTSAGAVITPADMLKRRLIKHDTLVKVLGNGEVTKALNVTAHSFSKGAAEKITKAGGKTTLLVGLKAAKQAIVDARTAAKKAKTDKK